MKKMEEINERIKREVCYKTLEQLSMEKLLPQYKECESVKKKIKSLHDILTRQGIEEEKRQKILKEYEIDLIPPGTKAAIRGNIFNKIIKDHIISFNLDPVRFELYFEVTSDKHPTSEIPDWYIREKETNRIIIGMNQLDLWGGGHQVNRGSKYIENTTHNNENSKLLCVVCNEIQFKTKKNKTYKLFEIGFKNDTLCYLNNLRNIINAFFTITD